MKSITTLILCTLLGACASSGDTSNACCAGCLEDGGSLDQPAVEIAQTAVPEVRYYVISDT